MTKTKKLLSLVLATIMILGCCGMTSFAINWPADLEAGTPVLYSTSAIKSVQIPVAEKFTTIDEEAKFTVYYSAEDIGESYNIFAAEEAGFVKAEKAYIAESVLHIDLSGLDLSEEGFYYISISNGALTGEDCLSILAITDGIEYHYASLSIIGKLQAVIGYFLSMITNLLSNGQTY